MPNEKKLYILRQLREERNLSLAAMAAYFNLSAKSGRNTVSQWERGDSIPAAHHRQTFIRYLDEQLGLREDAERFQRVWEVLASEWSWPVPTAYERQHAGDMLEAPEPVLLPQAANAPGGMRHILLTRVANISAGQHFSQRDRELLRINVQINARPVHPRHRTLALEQVAPLPRGSSIIDAFDAYQGALLILGAPGSGKTTLLLELAQVLVQRAFADINAPVPLIAYLSSWTNRFTSLEDWIVEEVLSRIYDVPRTLGAQWVANQQFVLLLDGLDEVALESQESCVTAINTYREHAGINPMAICSRIRAYERLAMPLRIQGAVTLEPLDATEINTYLDRVAPVGSQQIRHFFAHDPVLYEHAQTPLWLTLIARTYQALHTSTSDGQFDANDLHQQLFDAYIREGLQRHPSTQGITPETPRKSGLARLVSNSRIEPYNEAVVRQYLTQLAVAMRQHNIGVFLVEGLQPAWLSDNRQHWMVTHGLACTMAIGFGLYGALVFGTGSLMVVAPWRALILACAGGMLVGSVGGIIGYDPKIQPIEALQWSWTAMKSRLPTTLFYGALGGIVSAIIYSLVGGDTFLGLAFGITIGLVGGIGGALLDGLIANEHNEPQTPNQGIVRSAQTAIQRGLLFGLLIGLVFGPLVGIIVGQLLGAQETLITGLLGGIGGGLVLGLVGALRHGGRAVLQHVLLRLFLVREGMIPWKYVHFLEYCVQVGLLRRVGGGYIFFHPLLQDYFAEKVAEREDA
jgi:transcriptional regulator with XRE-family HTH domain/energy-coupling factor transporter ATP-binding protein EcfA2